MGNKEWIAFANEKKCNHAKSLIKSGFISWVNTANFEVGDIVQYCVKLIFNRL